MQLRHRPLVHGRGGHQGNHAPLSASHTSGKGRSARSAAVASVTGSPIRKLQVIGQAVDNLSDSSKSPHPHIPWKHIAGLRDRVIHDYFGVNLDVGLGGRREGPADAAASR